MVKISFTSAPALAPEPALEFIFASARPLPVVYTRFRSHGRGGVMLDSVAGTMVLGPDRPWLES